MLYQLWLLTARKICSASNFTRSAGNQDTHFTIFFADCDPFSFQSLIKFIFFMSIQAHSVCILNRTKCIFFPFSSSTQRVFPKLRVPIDYSIVHLLRKDRRRGCLCNILHLGTTFPSLFSKHNITAATTLISLCHAW